MGKLEKCLYIVELLSRSKSLSLKEINEHWEYSSLYDGEIIPKTFGRYKDYISNVFAIDIEYDAHSRNYYIANADYIKNNAIYKYLLSAFHVQGLTELAVKLSSAIGGTYLLRGAPDKICRKTAVVSGGGGVDSVIEAAKIGCDLLITGEMEHIMHHTAIENNVAIIALGHYASETTGPKALMKLIARTFNIPTIFADCPTGL